MYTSRRVCCVIASCAEGAAVLSASLGLENGGRKANSPVNLSARSWRPGRSMYSATKLFSLLNSVFAVVLIWRRCRTSVLGACIEGTFLCQSNEFALCLMFCAHRIVDQHCSLGDLVWRTGGAESSAGDGQGEGLTCRQAAQIASVAVNSLACFVRRNVLVSRGRHHTGCATTRTRELTAESTSRVIARRWRDFDWQSGSHRVRKVQHVQHKKTKRSLCYPAPSVRRLQASISRRK